MNAYDGMTFISDDIEHVVQTDRTDRHEAAIVRRKQNPRSSVVIGPYWLMIGVRRFPSCERRPRLSPLQAGSLADMREAFFAIGEKYRTTMEAEK